LSVTLISSYSSAAYVKTTTDPTFIGIGARPIGTGKAFVGLADDVNAIFINPAGLAGQKTWQVQSMTTRLLNVIDYISFAGTYNTDYGTFGLGYIGASLSGSFVTTMELSDGGGGIVFPVPAEESINYSSTVMLLSYGSDSQRFLNNNYLGWMNFDFMKKVDVGATLKIFSQGLSGGGITDGMSTGYDIDLGMLYKPLPYLSFGWNQINVLPVSMGGKITSSGGSEHSLPTTSKLGMALKVLGDDSLYGYTQPLIYLLDFDYMPLRTDYPTLFRTGFEWWPSNYLALRFGLDQDVIGADESSGFNVETNWSTGIGVQASGFKFDYAYHKYGIVTDNDTSYLSLSYSAPIEFAAPPPPPPPAPKEKGYLKIIPSQDKLITYDEGTSIKGKVLNVKDATKLTVNGNEVAFAQDGSFDSTWPLAIGKNTFEVKVFGANDQLLESTKIRLLRLTQFKDVQEGYWAKEPIELLATLGIVGGYPNGTFQPDRIINRAELTALLVRAKNPGTPEAVDTSFSDVPRKHWASYFIKLGADTGLVTGYKNGTFQPAKSLNRAEGVTILARFAELKLPEELTEGPFSDLPGRHWAAKAVTAARSAGMLVFLTDKPFDPNKELTRSEAAEIISRTAFAVQKINNLKDFDTY
jgi:hypothetical protein